LKHFIRNIFFYLNIVIALALLISYLAPFVDPSTNYLPAFFGLAFPILLIFNVLFIIYWIAIKQVKFLLSLIIVLIGWNHISGFFQFNLPEKSTNTSKLIKVLSYNVRLFDLYNWSNNKKTRNKIFNLIKEKQADVICFQEFYQDKTNSFSTLDTLVKFQNAKNVHAAYTFSVYNKYFFGIATFSKYPIVNKGKITFKNTNNICIYTDVKINQDTIRFYNNHLESIRFQLKNYNFLDSLSYKNEDERLKGLKDILKRLKRANSIRARQVDKISAHIKSSPYPVIVCGDFNDTPVSYTYHNMNNGLIDTFEEQGLGFGITYSRNFIFLRIDYLLHSPIIKAIKYQTIRKKYSDHYPILGIYDLSNISKK